MAGCIVCTCPTKQQQPESLLLCQFVPFVAQAIYSGHDPPSTVIVYNEREAVSGPSETNSVELCTFQQREKMPIEALTYHLSLWLSALEAKPPILDVLLLGSPLAAAILH